MTSRSKGLVAVLAVVVAAVTVTMLVTFALSEPADWGEQSSLVAGDQGAILDSAAVAMGDRLLTRGDRPALWDSDSLELVARLGGTQASIAFGLQPPTVLVSEFGETAAYSPDGTEQWRVDVGWPVAVGADGAVTLMSCDGDTCVFTNVSDGGEVAWAAEIEVDRQTLLLGRGVRAAHSLGSPVEALPSVAVVAHIDRESQAWEIVRIDPATGAVEPIFTSDEPVAVVVNDAAVAVLAGPMADDCSLSVVDHLGDVRSETQGDCAGADDGSTRAYIYGDGDQFVWVDADTIRYFDATGDLTTSYPLGSPAADPTPAGRLHPGTERDGWSLLRPDGSEVLRDHWEWHLDAGATAVVMARQVETGPFWRQSTVYEVAVVEVATGDVCGRQRTPRADFPVAKVLDGCRALVTSGEGANARNWVIGH